MLGYTTKVSKSTPPAAASLPSVSDDLLITPICAIFRRFLKRQGLKFTTERAQTLDVVLGKEHVFEADELLEEMKTAGHRVSRATVSAPAVSVRSSSSSRPSRSSAGVVAGVCTPTSTAVSRGRVGIDGVKRRSVELSGGTHCTGRTVRRARES